MTPGDPSAITGVTAVPTGSPLPAVSVSHGESTDRKRRIGSVDGWRLCICEFHGLLDFELYALTPGSLTSLICSHRLRYPDGIPHDAEEGLAADGMCVVRQKVYPDEKHRRWAGDQGLQVLISVPTAMSRISGPMANRPRT